MPRFDFGRAGSLAMLIGPSVGAGSPCGAARPSRADWAESSLSACQELCRSVPRTACRGAPRAEGNGTLGPVRRLLSILAGVALTALTCTAAWAGSPKPTVLDSRGTMVAAYGGWAAWSRWDSATSAYALELHSPAGAISTAAVAERGAPFDVELGPSGSGVAAVYSRCSDTSTLRGCRIYELRLGVRGATEQMLAAPGSSVHEPAIWRDRMVFLRRNPGGGERRPDNLLEWRIGSSDARSVTLPSSQGRGSSEAGRWPRGVTGAITGLTLDGGRIAYATSSSS